jgi:hypothetical protein
MSKHEVAELKRLLDAWKRLGSDRSLKRLLRFLDMYEKPIISALELAAR